MEITPETVIAKLKVVSGSLDYFQERLKSLRTATPSSSIEELERHVLGSKKLVDEVVTGIEAAISPDSDEKVETPPPPAA